MDANMQLTINSFRQVSLTFSKIPHISLTAVKFPDISRFSTLVITLYKAYTILPIEQPATCSTMDSFIHRIFPIISVTLSVFRANVTSL